MPCVPYLSAQHTEGLLFSRNIPASSRTPWGQQPARSHGCPGAVTPRPSHSAPPGIGSTKLLLCRGSETLPVPGSSQPLSSQSHCVLCCHSCSFPARQGDGAWPDGSDTRGVWVTQTFHCRDLGKSTQRTWLQGQGDSGVCASASKIPILFQSRCEGSAGKKCPVCYQLLNCAAAHLVLVILMILCSVECNIWDLAGLLENSRNV